MGMILKTKLYFLLFSYSNSSSISSTIYSYLNLLWFFYRFWGIKYLLVIGGVIGAFFIPEGQFASTWMVFGMIGGFFFIIIQLILIIDFAHSWAERWVCKYRMICCYLL